MGIFDAIVYGLVQGTTEFLPVSSSAHLALLPRVLNIADPGVSFDLMMHFGTLLAVLIYYRVKIWSLLKYIRPFVSMNGAVNFDENQKREYAYFKNLLLSTFCSFIGVVVLKSVALRYGRAPTSIAFFSIVFGVLMIVSDRFGKNRDQETSCMQAKVEPFKAALIGFLQSVAIFPGVSRSGATISTARFLGLGRSESADYSFLLCVPIILAGTASKILDVATEALVSPQLASSMPLGPMILGILVSFVAGILTIHYFLIFIRRIGITYFAFYRFAFALVILLALK